MPRAFAHPRRCDIAGPRIDFDFRHASTGETLLARLSRIFWVHSLRPSRRSHSHEPDWNPDSGHAPWLKTPRPESFDRFIIENLVASALQHARRCHIPSFSFHIQTHHALALQMLGSCFERVLRSGSVRSEGAHLFF